MPNIKFHRQNVLIAQPGTLPAQYTRHQNADATLVSEQTATTQTLTHEGYRRPQEEGRRLGISNSPSSLHTQPSGITTRPRTTLSIKPEYVRGKKPYFFEDKEWRSLKNDLKRTYINVQWQQFLDGVKSGDGIEALKQSMMATLASKDISENLKEKAEKYIQYKAGKRQYGYDQLLGKTSSFWTKGTTLESPIIRTEKGRFFKVAKAVTSELRERIKQQQGKNYRGGTFLGRGAFGTVKIAELLDEKDSTVVAAKMSSEEDLLFNESKMLDKMPANSRHFTTVRDFAFVPKKGKSTHEAILFLDIEIRGNMTSIMHKIKNSHHVTDREKLQRTLARQFVECVKEMHEQDVYHRDIKPDNFLFSKDGTIVIADFGTASIGDKRKKGDTGTLGYMAPEEMPKKSDSDKYALGQVLYDLYQTVTSSKGKPDNRDPLFNIVQLLANPKPEMRPSLEKILNSPYFQGEVYTDDELLKVIDNL